VFQFLGVFNNLVERVNMDNSNLPVVNDVQVEAVDKDNKSKLRKLTIVILALEPIIILLMTIGLFFAVESNRYMLEPSGIPLRSEIGGYLFVSLCFAFPILGILGVVLGSIGYRNKKWSDYKGIFTSSIAILIICGSCLCLLILGMLGS
jgi:hypothetical protein